MVKYIFLLLIVGAIISLESCSSTSASSTGSASSSTPSAHPYMIGRIEVISNEPFTKLALRTDETHVFLLRAPKEVEKELTRHQQGVVKLFYSGRQEVGKDHYLDVDHIEISENKK